jgi:Phage tail protein.
MLHKVEISTEQGLTLELPLESLSGYVVKDIEGLDPVKATLVSSSFAMMDGEQYQSSRRESRNILLKLGLESDYSTLTNRELRLQLYKFLMPKSHVRLRFFIEDAPTVDIYGRVESFDSTSFTKEPEAVISLVCHQPDFYSPTPVVIEGLTVSDSTELMVNYEGTVESGLILTVRPDRDLSGFVMHHRPPDGKMRTLEFSEPLAAGDILKLSTVTGGKFARRTREAIEESVLYGVSPYSAWIQLFPGLNALRMFSEGAPVPYTVEYTTKFGGI